jgi:hypothetical protein
MSTWIYNGIKFKSKDWKEVLDQLVSIKSKAAEIGNSNISRRDLEMFITHNELSGEGKWDIFHKIQEGIDSTNKRLFNLKFNDYPHTYADSHLKFNFSVILYPTKEGDIYGYYFNDLPKYDKLLRPFTDEFIYYDSSDQPDNVTDEEWDARGKKWDELVPDRFSDTGFKFNIVCSDDLDRGIVIEFIKEILPSIKRDKKIEDLGIKDEKTEQISK